MKKNISIFIVIFLLTSCATSQKQGVVEETGEIVDGYIDTLEGSVGDARAVKELMEKQQQDLQKNLR